MTVLPILERVGTKARRPRLQLGQPGPHLLLAGQAVTPSLLNEQTTRLAKANGTCT